MHASRRVWLVLAVAATSRAVAQTATVSGVVTRDSSGARVDGAEVAIVSLRRGATTNQAGEFRIAGLAAGRYEISIRRLGFLQLMDTVDLADGASIERTYVLHPSVAKLDSMRVVGRGERKYISPGLNAFEERRKAGFGYFVEDSVIRKNEDRQLSSILRRMPALNIMPYLGSAFVGSTRAMGSGRSAKAIPGDARSPSGCWSTVFLDGVVVYTILQGQRSAPAPDFNSFDPKDLAGIEYYPGNASLPAQYNATEYGCGTLLLWTRER
jgi:hypothetical protein